MTTPTDRFAFPKPTDTDSADLPTQLGNIVEQIEDRLSYAGAEGGFKYTAADQTAAGTTLAVLGTPDRVSGIVMHDGDILLIDFVALIKNSVANAGSVSLVAVRPSDAAEFTIGNNGVGPTGTGSYSPIATYRNASGQQAGLVVPAAGGGIGFGAQIAPDPLRVWCDNGSGAYGLAPGTYNIEARFARSSGTLNVKERILKAYKLHEFPASGV